MDIKVTNRLNY